MASNDPGPSNSSLNSNSTTAPDHPQPPENNQNRMDQKEWALRNRLYHAALSGDYATAEEIIGESYHILNEEITGSGRGETILHVAVGAKQTHFVTNLLRDFNRHIDLYQRDANGNTAFFSACAAGDIEIVEKFLQLQVPPANGFITTAGGGGVSPLYIAVSLGHAKVASKLFDGNHYDADLIKQPDRDGIFFNCINNDLYDLALKMLEHDSFVKGAENVRDTKELTALHILSRKPPSVFATPKPRGLCTKFSRFFRKSPGLEESTALKLVKQLWNLTLRENKYNFSNIITEIKSPFHLLMEAIKVGNIDFVVVLINSYPELIWAYDVDKSNKEIHQSMFYYAVKYRQVEIFKLIHEVGLSKQLVEAYEDDHGNNLLHIAAVKPPDSRLRSIVGSALQMREQILWFQEVRKIVVPSLRNKMNVDGETPKDLFANQHNELMKESEKWMKRNANICLLVATIIVTVIFQANFDISADDKAGSKPPFKDIILITNNIAMCTSSVAVMLNLFIITSRFSEDDLFRPLPCAFIWGIVLLYIAITCMLTSFSLSTFIATKSLAIRISCSLELLPIILFPFLVCGIFVDLNIFPCFIKSKFKPRKRMLGSYYGDQDMPAPQSVESQPFRAASLELDGLETGTLVR